jgi:hypothetical protein
MVSNTQMIGQSLAAAELSVRDQEADASPAVPGGDDPAPAAPDARPALDPTRYGDWEKNGRCIDF